MSALNRGLSAGNAPFFLYRLVTATDRLKFSQRVSRAINEGWTLHGQPVMTPDPSTGGFHYAQAVTRESVDPTDYDVRVLLGSDSEGL
jgi:hypothetical protein